jgi:hypothetical protein
MHTAIRDLYVLVGGHNVDSAILQRLAVVHRPHGQRRLSRQDLLEVAEPGRIEMLSDDDWCSEGRG